MSLCLPWHMGCVEKWDRDKGTGTSERACGDLRTRDEGLEDIKFGTRRRVGRGRGDVKYRDACAGNVDVNDYHKSRR